jgi:hypothetical protein
MSDVKVASVSVEIADARATRRLLADIPHSQPIRRHLTRTLVFHHWDESTQRAFWVTGDGTRLRCVTASGLTGMEMAEIVSSCSYQAARATFALSPQLISRIIEAEMDVVVGLVN